MTPRSIVFGSFPCFMGTYGTPHAERGEIKEPEKDEFDIIID